MTLLHRWIPPALVLVVLLVAPALSAPASAADVPVTLIALNIAWHVGSGTGAVKPTISVAPGDVLRLTIENQDTFAHTFTLPRFSIDRALAAGATVFVNITTSAADSGKWQFYCAVASHTSGTYPNLDGMVGWVQVGTTAPPTPGFDTVLVIAALVGVAAVARVASRRKDA